MKRKLISSSVISEVGYENFVLEVKFKDGDVYHYYSVPKTKYLSLLKAKSKGSYFNKNIRLSYGSMKLKKV